MEFAGPSIIIYHLTYVSTFVWHKMQQPPVLSTLHNHKIYSGPSLAGKLYNLTARSQHISVSWSPLMSPFLSASRQLSPVASIPTFIYSYSIDYYPESPVDEASLCLEE